MDVYLVKILRSGNGDPPYWYADKIGETFECIYEDKSCVSGINGFGDKNYSLKPPKDLKAGEGYKSSVIRPQDSTVVKTWQE